ncbi:hypothetical protein BOX15_Mlig020088g1 [Macrostomum lignano]|uniref:Myb_DNA-bind_4 domain-containing protein n=2 Tax=Macrostomum lignano TaxID=282301 RepID=A0A1I8G6Z6_9PLAT|nr:hypothetical protein BOX15_Mlig020088g1 [Macrostomum lignano]
MTQRQSYSFLKGDIVVTIEAASEGDALQFFTLCEFSHDEGQTTIKQPNANLAFGRITSAIYLQASEPSVAGATNSQANKDDVTAESYQQDKKNAKELNERKETKCFLNCTIKRKKDFDSKVTKKKVLWKRIEADMKAEGFGLTSEQCENKYKALKRKFSNFKLQQAKSGAGKKDIDFEEELQELFGSHAEVMPTFLLTANVCHRPQMKISTAGPEESMQQEIGLEEPQAKATTARKSMTRSPSRYESPNKATKKLTSEHLCETIISKLDQASKEREEMKQMLQKQHEERMERQDKFLELFAKSLDK